MYFIFCVQMEYQCNFFRQFIGSVNILMVQGENETRKNDSSRVYRTCIFTFTRIILEIMQFNTQLHIFLFYLTNTKAPDWICKGKNFYIFKFNGI